MPQSNKRILLLAYDFPPYLSVGGIRPSFWFEYLKNHKIITTVVTRQWESKNGPVLDYIARSKSPFLIKEIVSDQLILRTPYSQNFSNRILSNYGHKRFRIFRKAFSYISELSQFYFKTGTKKELYNIADDYLSHNEVDLIIATGDPFVLFHYANKLGKKHKIPWVADYRDPWSHYYERENKLKYFFISQKEKRIVKNAAHITTVSDFIARKVNLLVGPIPSTILPNGFDPFVLKKTIDINQSSELFTIAHAGSVYDWHPLERFLESLAQFQAERPLFDFQVVFYGLNQPERIVPVFEKHPSLERYIILKPRCTNEELITQLRSHHVMLLFNYYAYMGTKIFDYLGIERRMLLCFENDPIANQLKEKYYRINDTDANQHLQAETIREHNAGDIAIDSTDLIRILHHYANEFELKSCIECQSVNVDNYSRLIQVKQLAEIIHTQF